MTLLGSFYEQVYQVGFFATTKRHLFKKDLKVNLFFVIKTRHLKNQFILSLSGFVAVKLVLYKWQMICSILHKDSKSHPYFSVKKGSCEKNPQEFLQCDAFVRNNNNNNLKKKIYVYSGCEASSSINMMPNFYLFLELLFPVKSHGLLHFRES